VKHNFKKGFFVIFIISMMFCLMQTAFSAETFRTTDNVNFRASPSTDAGIIKTLNTGANVDVLEHDPANWSKVAVSGTVGYIRSDFLKFPVGSAPASFKTTAGVYFRTGPSTDAGVIKALGAGTAVELVEHDPAGWSSVRLNGTPGFIKSSYLALADQNAKQPAPAPAASASGGAASGQPLPSAVYRTTDNVNFRTGPTTESEIIRTLRAGTAVDMVEHDPGGWSSVKVDGISGYIKSDYLSAGGSAGRSSGAGSGGAVELLDWSAAKDVVPKGELLKIIDVRTGETFNLKCFSKGGHADVEPPTKEDTDTIYRTRNGVWSWDARPVWVIIGDRTLAASLNGQPHAGSTISNNGMNGHLCLHFNGTVTNSKSYQKDLNNAVIEAWNAAN